MNSVHNQQHPIYSSTIDSACAIIGGACKCIKGLPASRVLAVTGPSSCPASAGTRTSRCSSGSFRRPFSWNVFITLVHGRTTKNKVRIYNEVRLSDRDDTYRRNPTCPNCHCDSSDNWNLFCLINNSVLRTAIVQMIKVTIIVIMTGPLTPTSYLLPRRCQR